eukprot:g63230.t1
MPQSLQQRHAPQTTSRKRRKRVLQRGKQTGQAAAQMLETQDKKVLRRSGCCSRSLPAAAFMVEEWLRKEDSFRTCRECQRGRLAAARVVEAMQNAFPGQDVQHKLNDPVVWASFSPPELHWKRQDTYTCLCCCKVLDTSHFPTPYFLATDTKKRLCQSCRDAPPRPCQQILKQEQTRQTKPQQSTCASSSSSSRLPALLFLQPNELLTGTTHANTESEGREGCVGSKLNVCFVNCVKTSDELLRQYFLQQPGQRTDTVVGLDMEWKPTYQRGGSQYAHIYVVGLDMEWKPTYQRGFQSNPVALVQVCNESLALLMRVRSFKSLPPALVELLQHPQLLKAGVGVHEDVRKLQSSFPGNVISAQGVLDVASGFHAVCPEQYHKGIGLAKLLSLVWCAALGKSKSVTCSNWEAQPLSAEQQRYAALDAWASWRLGVELVGHPQFNASKHVLLPRAIKQHVLSPRAPAGPPRSKKALPVVPVVVDLPDRDDDDQARSSASSFSCKRNRRTIPATSSVRGASGAGHAAPAQFVSTDHVEQFMSMDTTDDSYCEKRRGFKRQLKELVAKSKRTQAVVSSRAGKKHKVAHGNSAVMLAGHLKKFTPSKHPLRPFTSKQADRPGRPFTSKQAERSGPDRPHHLITQQQEEALLRRGRDLLYVCQGSKKKYKFLKKHPKKARLDDEP